MPSVVRAWLPSWSLHSMARPSACPDKQEARATAARCPGPGMGMSGGQGTMLAAGAGHVPRPGPGLGTIHKCPRPGSKNGHVPGGRASKRDMSPEGGLQKWACPRREGFKNGHVRWTGQPRLMSGDQRTMRAPGAGHVPRPRPGLGTIHTCPRPGSKNGHVPGGEGFKNGHVPPGHKERWPPPRGRPPSSYKLPGLRERTP